MGHKRFAQWQKAGLNQLFEVNARETKICGICVSTKPIFKHIDIQCRCKNEFQNIMIISVLWAVEKGGTQKSTQ